jgi:hypothetical protein
VARLPRFVVPDQPQHVIVYSYQRTGTLWEGRYKATLIDSEAYLLT